MNTLPYIIESTTIWAIFFLIYICFLRKETFFHINRWYLIVSVGFGLTLPLLKYLELPANLAASQLSVPVQFIASGPEVIAQNVSDWQENSGFSASSFFMFIYITGIAFLLARFAKGLFKIYLLVREGELLKHPEFTLVQTKSIHPPFSFFGYVFISDKFGEDKNLKKILQHEISHVREWHSLDIVLFELLQIVFWFNPLIYLYRQAVRETHEFIADAVVASKGDKLDYSKLLLSGRATGFEMALTHSFFNSFLKTRLRMIHKKKSPMRARVKYFLVVPLVIFLFLMCTKDSMHLPLPVQSTSIEQGIDLYSYDEEVFRVVEEMPRFPGCEDETGENKEKEDCAKEKMLEYIYQNLTYPEQAKSNGIQGMCVIQFIVDKDGHIKDSRIVRDIGSGCGTEAKRVVDKMNDIAGTWRPGIQNNKEVDVLYTLPVRFQLDFNSSKELFNSTGPEDFHGAPIPPPPPPANEYIPVIPPPAPPSPPPPPAPGAKELFKVVEEMPRFPGCELIVGTAKDKEDCAKNKLLDYINENLQYPSEARDKQVEGMVVVQFLINSRGGVEDINVVRDIGSGCGLAAQKLVEDMNGMNEKWTPGMQRGKAVSVLYTIPIRFQLNG